MQKVIFLSGAVPPQTGGELYNYKVAEYFAATDLEQEFVSLHNYRHYLRLGRLPVVGDLIISIILAIALYQYNGIFIEDHYFSRYLVLTNLIQKYIRQNKIAIVVHLFSPYDSCDPCVMRRAIYRWLERFYLSFADVVVLSSEYSKREVVSLGIDPSKLHVFQPGLDREKFAMVPPLEEPVRHEKKILCVANYIPRKGIRYLIEAYAQANRGEFKLHLVGNVKDNAVYYKKLQKQVAALGLEEDVYFHNGEDQDNIRRLYSTSDIFVLPSLKETFGIVLIEAMHYRLPIITTNTSAMPDLVTDGENGLLIPPKDIPAMAWAISRLISSPLVRQRMAELGYQRIKDAYVWEDTSSQFLSLVQTLNAASTPTSLEPC
ncbi:MAG: glycosyltransferase family 4 protein [Cyanobacteria bacterium J06627_3]